MKGREMVEALRKEVEPLNKQILEHPYVVKAERGELAVEQLKKFVVNQLYIVPHDMRSIAVMLSKSRYRDEEEFFKTALDGDYRALRALEKLARELGIEPGDPGEPDPRAVAYTHYLSWLALHGTPGDSAVALVVNLPVWGANTARLAKALKERYGIRSTEFLEMFAGPYEEFEKMAYPVVERYADMKRYRVVVRMIQCYEKMFWDALLEG